jgi:lipid II:glycine glycyltransferase (peptidoglycan interpeptide bridge formation enzyme)
MERKEIPQEIINQLKHLQKITQDIIHEFGLIEMQQIDLNERKQVAQQCLSDLKQEQQTLSQFIEQQYGEGTIDLETREFSPIEGIG